MAGSITVTGMVLSATPVGEYDRRLVILTKERGLISAFARGARKPNSALVAASSTFAFGQFELFEGRSSYSVNKADITNYFRELSEDIELVFYASYFTEVAEYYGQENLSEKDRLLLLYQTLRALESKKFSSPLVRAIYELRTMYINGEYPTVSSCMKCGAKEKLISFSMRDRGCLCEKCTDEFAVKISQSALYAFQFILSAPIEKLFSFRLTDEVEKEVVNLLESYRKRYEEHEFKTLAFLETSL